GCRPFPNCKFLKRILFTLLVSAYLASLTLQNLPSAHVYERRSEVRHIQCDRVFQGDSVYAKSVTKIKLVPRSAKLDMSCEAVRNRVLSRRNPPTGFRLAFAKNVFMDYEFLEEQLAVSYSEENTFCFAPDRKATVEFRRKIFALSLCLDNVHISSDEYEMDSNGHGQSRAFIG
ncbi:hypothetical protein PENTCL1PPCAC_29838, partial [Pristionchus entomophagus]